MRKSDLRTGETLQRELNIMTEITGMIGGLYIGKVEHRWDGKPPSAIRKTSITGPASVNNTGFVDDEQADLRVHGGTEKALHHYAADHLSFWKEKFADRDSFFEPGCFGENISTEGITETDLCLGDIFRLGQLRVQISQGRQPCWKLAAHAKIPELAAEFQITGRTGWYYRVLDGGFLSVGDQLELVERPNPKWLLSEVISARFKPGLNPLIAKDIAGLDGLAESWRTAFLKKSQKMPPEDTDERLIGPGK